jgi:nucleotide-binding universal stress UspA family protein
VDFSRESVRTIGYAKAVAKRFGAALVLLHVIEPVVCEADYGYGPVANEVPNKGQFFKARLRLNRIARVWSAAGPPVETIVVHGRLGSLIQELTACISADLVVVDERLGRQMFAHQSSLRAGGCPWLLIPEHMNSMRSVTFPKQVVGSGIPGAESALKQFAEMNSARNRMGRDRCDC